MMLSNRAFLGNRSTELQRKPFTALVNSGGGIQALHTRFPAQTAHTVLSSGSKQLPPVVVCSFFRTLFEPDCLLSGHAATATLSVRVCKSNLAYLYRNLLQHSPAGGHTECKMQLIAHASTSTAVLHQICDRVRVCCRRHRRVTPALPVASANHELGGKLNNRRK